MNDEANPDRNAQDRDREIEKGGRRGNEKSGRGQKCESTQMPRPGREITASRRLACTNFASWPTSFGLDNADGIPQSRQRASLETRMKRKLLTVMSAAVL